MLTFPGPIIVTENMTERRKAEVHRVNKKLMENKEVEKMVKQVVGSGPNVTEEQKTVLKAYMSSVHGLNNMFGEKLEEPININGNLTKEIRDKDTKISKKVSNKKYGCGQCSKAFPSAIDLADHVLTHSENFSETDSEHMTQNDSDGSLDSNIYKCETCPKICSSHSHLKQHIENCKGHYTPPNKRGPYKKKFSCQHCPKEVSSKLNLEKHMESSHKDLNSPKQNDSKKNEKQNKKANTPNIDKQVQCDVCSHLFGSKKIYIEHKKTCNPPLFSPEKTVPCDQCTEKFFNKGALAKHKEQCHN